ncbi:MAG TPA: hypothetical protein VFP72_09035 [Kineosporiaceae bacterium]|nr:hypothetical protein [Kineosporiaceae bacterium]
MIDSADEFVRLRTSEGRQEQDRASREQASVETWLDIIERYPEMKEWVARNTSVPLEILEILRRDPDEPVVWTVRQKRSWARTRPEDSGRATGLDITRSATWKREALGSEGK